MMLLTNVKLATMNAESSSPSYELIEDGALFVEKEKITWLGAINAMPDSLKSLPKINLEGRVVTPGLIDCHTHIVHGGDRVAEFESRLEGMSYEFIAKEGGGIATTVLATRASTQRALLNNALARVDALIAEGVCLLEIKSGYGLDIETELKMLRVARLIEKYRPIRVKTTFLGAHALFNVSDGSADSYIDEVCIPALTKAFELGLVDAVDGFCEGIAFTPQQIERVFKKAGRLGLPVKLHAEQLSHQGGTQLAARYEALSADHLEYASNEDVRAMLESDMVATMLPGAFYNLQEKQLPPIASFREVGVPMAVATDCNPGSSPLTSILGAMNMACTLFKMTPQESLAGTTKFAAKALGQSDCGVLRAGMRADLAIWNVQHPAELAYWLGFNPLWKRVFGGKI